MFILKRETLERLANKTKVCASGFTRHAERAKEQEGVDFGNGVIGNGIDTYYPDGFTDAEYLRIAEDNAQIAAWFVNHRSELGIPPPSPEVFDEIARKMREQRGRRR